MIKKTLLLLAFIFACTLTAYAQEAEFSSSGGTAGAITAGVGSGTAGRVPQFVSATSLEDSKMLTSVGGTSTGKGVWTLYDDTATAGQSGLVIREGAAAAGTGGVYPLAIFANNGTTPILLVAPTFNTGWTAVSALRYVFNTDGGFSLNSTGLRFSDAEAVDGAYVGFRASSYATDDATLRHEAAGVLAQRAGTTSQAFRLYDSYTDASNYGRFSMSVNAGFNSWDLKPETAGTGTSRHLRIQAGGGMGMYLVASAFTIGGAYNVIIDPGLTAPDLSSNVNDIVDLGTTTENWKTAYISTSIQGTRTQAISAEGGGGTEFVEIAVASGASVGGFIEYTVQADDGTDREIESGVVSFTATNEAGTEAANVSILGTPAETPGAALTVSFDVTTGLTNVFRVKVISDSPALVPTTHKIEYRVHVNSGTTTVTPLT